MNKVQPETQQSSVLLESLVRTLHRYTSDLDAALERNGLSGAKLGVLQVLVEAGEPLPLGQLAERLACVKSNITQLVDRIEADGLVQRVPDAEDRRSKRAVITAEGRRRYEIGMKIKVEVEHKLLHGLSPDEREQLATVLAKLGLAGAQ